MENYETYTGSLYDYTAGTSCGVLVTEKVMRRLVALQAAHLEAVKRILSDEADRGNVFPSMWTLHYPDGVQTTVNFIDTSADLKQRIKSAASAAAPRHVPLAFIAGGMQEAKEMADARHAVMAAKAENDIK